MMLIVCLSLTLFPVTAQAAAEILVDGTLPYTLDKEGLQYAIDAAVDGDTVKLGGDIDLGPDGVTVTNKTIILDLNDHTITYSGTGAAVTVSGTGNLTVTDSGTRGTITSASECRLLQNGGSGTLTLARGTIKGTGNTFGISNKSTGSVNITGGRVETTNRAALLLDSSSSGDVTVSGGTLISINFTTINHVAKSAKLTISGDCVIDCLSNNSGEFVISMTQSTASLEINGGRIVDPYVMSTKGTVVINGGYIRPRVGVSQNITVNGGFLVQGLDFYSTGTGIVNGGYIYSSTKPVTNGAGDSLIKYSMTLIGADGKSVKDIPITGLSTNPTLSYEYGLNDVQTDAGLGALHFWLPEGITWISVTAGGNTYSGPITSDTKLRLSSQNPAADVTTVAKTSASQTSVAFPLTTAPAGTWKVYDSETATDTMTGVSATLSDTTLTLTASAGSIQAGDYYISVTEANKNESARLKLTVEEAPPIYSAAVPVITNNLSTAQVEYNQNAAATPSNCYR